MRTMLARAENQAADYRHDMHRAVSLLENGHVAAAVRVLRAALDNRPAKPMRVISGGRQ
jgi:hypothetical protein